MTILLAGIGAAVAAVLLARAGRRGSTTSPRRGGLFERLAQPAPPPLPWLPRDLARVDATVRAARTSSATRHRLVRTELAALVAARNDALDPGARAAWDRLGAPDDRGLDLDDLAAVLDALEAP